MSNAANTVSVVTTDGTAGRSGVTVSAMSSVSADSERPTLLVCVHNLSPVCGGILKNRVFCVNLLRDDQSFIADTFAGRIKPPGEDKFSCTDWTAGRTGAPVVADHLVAFDCELIHNFPIGTHVIFVGQVVDTIIHEGYAPLIYSNRRYGTPLRLESGGSPAHPIAPNSLRIGCFFPYAPVYMPRLVSALAKRFPDMDISFIVGHQGQVHEALRANACDIAFSCELQRGLRQDRQVRIEPLADASPYALLPDGHRLAASSSVSLADLAPLPMILLEQPPGGQHFLRAFRQRGLSPDIRLRSPSFEMVRGIVGQGLGYSILVARPATDATYDGSRVVARPLAEEVLPGKIALATAIDRELKPEAQCFAELCRSYFSGLGEENRLAGP